MNNKSKVAIDELLIFCLGCKENEIEDRAHIVDDLGADSLALVDLAVKVGAHFKFEFNEADMIRMETVSDLYNIISDKINGH